MDTPPDRKVLEQATEWALRDSFVGVVSADWMVQRSPV